MFSYSGGRWAGTTVQQQAMCHITMEQVYNKEWGYVTLEQVVQCCNCVTELKKDPNSGMKKQGVAGTEQELPP